jgi:hypothetical protein
MAALVVLAVIALAFGILFGGILAISWAIRREDKHGGLTGRAPNWSCQGARRVTGMHAARWEHRDTPTFA